MIMLLIRLILFFAAFGIICEILNSEEAKKEWRKKYEHLWNFGEKKENK
jgi:hypothetical protein